MRRIPMMMLGFSSFSLTSYVVSYLLLLMPPLRQNDVVISPAAGAGWATHVTGKCGPDYAWSNGPAMHAFFAPIHAVDRLVRRSYWEGGAESKVWTSR